MARNIAALRQKAESGSCVGQSILGLCYLYGHDVETNYAEAFRWLSAAAAQGSSRAILNLGFMYSRGMGMAPDASEAVRLLTAVATPDQSSDAFAARIELARIYSGGRGVDVNPDESLKWYRAAIALRSDDQDSAEVREAMAYIARMN
jgi:uncharacterized protein